MLSPRDLLDRGLKNSREGRYRAGRRDFLAGLQRDPDPDLRSRLLTALAVAETDLGHVQTAYELCVEAMDIAGAQPGSRGAAHTRLALVFLRKGDMIRAVEHFEAGLRLVERSSIERPNALVDYGVVLLETFELAAAARVFSEAAEIFGHHGDEVGRSTSLHNLGYARMLQGELAEALLLMDEARPVLDPVSDTIKGVNAMDRAEVLLHAGRLRDAVLLLDTAAETFARLGLPHRRGHALLIAAGTLLQSDPAAARRRARQAMRTFRSHDSEPMVMRAEAVALLAETHPTPAWFKAADRVSSLLRAHGLLHDAQILDLHSALNAANSDRLDLARLQLRRGRTRPTDSLTERLLERQVKAELALATGRRKNALHHLRVGLDLLQDWQSSFGSLDLMSSVAGHGRELARRGIEVALGYDDPELAFEWSERARSLATRVVPVRPPADPQAAADLVEIRRLTVEEPRPGTREARRLVELRERVSQRAWRGRGSGEVRDVASLAEVRLALGSDTALVSYLWDGRDIVALTVTDEDARVENLCADWLYQDLANGLQADLDMSAASLSPAMADVVRRSARDRLDQIADLLIAPLIGRIGDRRVAITQAGIVSGVPWGSLRGLVGRPLTVAATATSWLATRGDLRVESAGFVAGPRVPRAEEEVAKSASAWPRSALLTGADATVEGVVELAGGVDLLHISAHGRHSADNPLFSGVELADGSMYGYDIDRLRAVPTVVILSACEVGRSTQRWAEESLGMVNAWLHAGARCVIASPAAVADDFACELLQDVHRAMSSGAAPAEALATATADEPSTFMCFGVGW